jgi:hypothetical protein
MERGPVGVIKPVTGVEREELNLSALRQCDPLIVALCAIGV